MISRVLGRTGLKVSIMGMGTGGGADPLGQRSGRPRDEVYQLLHRAYALGINFFDTAPGYMDSEVLLGTALKSLPRDTYTVSTKIALASAMPGDPIKVMRADEIESAVDLSLRRLQMSHIDLLLIGVADPVHRDLVVNEHLPVLQRLKKAGKVRFLGSTELSRSDGDHQWLQSILPEGFLDVAMVGHNMINQSAQRSVFPLCQRMNLGVANVFTVRRVFGVPGRLGEVLRDLVSRGLVDQAVLADANPLSWILESGEAGSLIEAAYRYAAYTKGVTTVMNGANQISMLEENLGSIQKGPLSPATVERLGSIFGRVSEAIGN